jgi:hypothetical protein
MSKVNASTKLSLHLHGMRSWVGCLSNAQTNLNAISRRSQAPRNFLLPHSSLMQLTHSLRLRFCQWHRPTAFAAKQALPLVTPVLIVRQPLDRCVAILLHSSCLRHVPSLESSHPVFLFIFAEIPFCGRSTHDITTPSSAITRCHHQKALTAAQVRLLAENAHSL